MSAEDAQRYREARGIGKPHPEHPHRIEKMEDGRFLAKCRYCRKRGSRVVATSGAALAWLGEHGTTKMHQDAVAAWGVETEEDRVMQDLLSKS